MVKYNDIKKAMDVLVEHWGEDGKRVIEEAYSVDSFDNTFSKFLEYCSACGGNWGGMLLTGIKRFYPNVWEVIPENMGCFAWECLLHTLILCGVDMNEKDGEND